MITKNSFRKHPIRVGLAIACVLLFVVLKVWDHGSPLTVQGWNEKEISRITINNPEEFTFAVFGDNKSNRSFFEPLLRDISRHQEIAFAIGVGDLVDGGEMSHYSQFFKQLRENLEIPFIGAIGNHDLYGRETTNYRTIFGPTYHSFQLGQAYFLILDAFREEGFDKAERRWLEEELQKSQSSKGRFVFMHVPPFDPRGSGFNKCLVEPDSKDLLDLFKRYNVTHLFASHIHGYFSGVWEGLSYTITGGGGAALQGSDPQHFFHHYVMAHFNNGKLDTAVRRIDSDHSLTGYVDSAKSFLFGWGLLVVAAISLATLGLSAGRNRGSRPSPLKRSK